jgi:hypothetical protein
MVGQARKGNLQPEERCISSQAESATPAAMWGIGLQSHANLGVLCDAGAYMSSSPA